MNKCKIAKQNTVENTGVSKMPRLKVGIKKNVRTKIVSKRRENMRERKKGSKEKK